jgi:hypothetical protein
MFFEKLGTIALMLNYENKLRVKISEENNRTEFKVINYQMTMAKYTRIQTVVIAMIVSNYE